MSMSGPFIERIIKNLHSAQQLTRRQLGVSQTTVKIIIIVSSVALAISIILFMIFILYRRSTRHTSSRGQYKTIKKRNRPRSSRPDPKHISLSTISTANSRRQSSISVSGYQKRDLSDLEAQSTEYQSVSQLQRNTSVTSKYSSRTEDFSKGTTAFDPSNLISHTRLPERKSPTSRLKAPEVARQSSTRVKNYYTDVEYLQLIDQEVTTLTNNEPAPLPPIPEKSRQRSSHPTNIDERLGIAFVTEGALNLPKGQLGGSRSMEPPVGRLELA